MLRKWGTMVVAAAFIASSTAAFAATGDTQQSKSVQQGALAPGKAAGVEQAQIFGPNGVLIVVGGVIVIGGLAWALSGTGNGTPSTTTTAAP